MVFLVRNFWGFVYIFVILGFELQAMGVTVLVGAFLEFVVERIISDDLTIIASFLSICFMHSQKHSHSQPLPILGLVSLSILLISCCYCLRKNYI